MGEQDRRHVIILVSGEAGEHLDTLRRRWDPVMAEQIGAHITVVYPDEAPDPGLLRARVLAAAQRIPPFPLRLGPVTAHESKPRRGVYHLVADPVGVFGWLREFLLAPPFTAHDVVPHASITHPRTSRRGRHAWRALAGADPDLELRVGELCLARFDGSTWSIDETVALGGVDTGALDVP